MTKTTKTKKTKPRWRRNQNGWWEHPDHGSTRACAPEYWYLKSKHKPGEYLGGAATLAHAKRYLESLTREAEREKRARKIRSGGLAVPEAFAS